MPNLRERHKLQTRSLISDVATRLFLQRGFEEVTIADVAVAGVAKRLSPTTSRARKISSWISVRSLSPGRLAPSKREPRARRFSLRSAGIFWRHWSDAIPGWGSPAGSSPAWFSAARRYAAGSGRSLRNVKVRLLRPFLAGRSGTA